MRGTLILLPLLALACGPSRTTDDTTDDGDAGTTDPTDGGTTTTDGGTVTEDPAIPESPVQCTTNKHWTGGNRGSSQHNPGQACIDCHDSQGRAPNYTYAGTAFATNHEPDDCYGASGYRITIIGTNGATLSMNTNSAGNFYSTRSVPGPFLATITAPDGSVRHKKTRVSSGDCNLCHTQDGTNLETSEDAAGRIVIP